MLLVYSAMFYFDGLFLTELKKRFMGSPIHAMLQNKEKYCSKNFLSL